MSYADARLQAVRDAATSVLDTLLASYDPDRPTVILLPGGMGSQLDRSNAAYTGDPIPLTDFAVLWIGLGVLLDHTALNLEIDPNGEDADSYLIVPDGPLRFPSLAAYAGTQRFFADNHVNYAVLGYDWRRDLQEGAISLHEFLSDFRTEVQARFQRDPLSQTSLLCHSQGGLVAKLYLAFPNNFGPALQAVITVAAPFYGTASQMPRYFKGDPTLNLLYRPADVARITGTLPGPYVLLPMDHATWEARKDVLQVPQYPVQAPDGADIDPYDIANVGHYPSWVAADFLEAARLARVAIDADLPDGILRKVFQLRAVSTATDAGFIWAPLPADFDPASSPDPLQTVRQVGGDGTVPEFSSHLAQSDAAHVLTVPTSQLHEDLAENARVLQAVKFVLDNGRMPADADITAPDETYTQPATASRDEVAQLLTAAGNGQLPADHPRLRQPDMARGILREFLK